VQLLVVAVELGAGRIGVVGNSLAVVVDSLAAGVDTLRIEELGDIEAVLDSLCFQRVGTEAVQAAQGSLGLQWELLVVVQQAVLPEEGSQYRAVGLVEVAEVELLVEKPDCMQRMPVVDLAEVVGAALLEEELDYMECRQVAEQAAEVAVERNQL